MRRSALPYSFLMRTMGTNGRNRLILIKYEFYLYGCFVMESKILHNNTMILTVLYISETRTTKFPKYLNARKVRSFELFILKYNQMDWHTIALVYSFWGTLSSSSNSLVSATYWTQRFGGRGLVQLITLLTDLLFSFCNHICCSSWY